MKPIIVESKGSTVFPCGQCKNCRINRKRQWQSRLLLHAASWPHSVFLTLTYRDPPGGGPPHVLHKRHLQNFFKRLRHGRERDFCSYLATGEYGERTFRAHYHVLLFSRAFLGARDLEQIWGHGHVHVGDVQPESIDYCLAYCLKGRKGMLRSDARPAEFVTFSQGIGNAGLISLLESFSKTGLQDFPREFRLYGKKWPLSRRHRELVRDHGWDLTPRTDEETLIESEKALLVMQGVSWDSPEYLAWLEKRKEVLERLRSRRLRDYYLAKNGHQRKRNETF